MPAINNAASVLRHNAPWNIRADGASNGTFYTASTGTDGLATTPWGVGITYYVASHTVAGRWLWSKHGGVSDGWLFYANGSHEHGFYAHSTSAGAVWCAVQFPVPTYLDSVIILMALVTPGVDIKLYGFNSGTLLKTVAFPGNYVLSSAIETAFGANGASPTPPTGLHISSKFSFTGTPSPAQFATMASYVTTYQGFPRALAGWNITSCYNFRTGRRLPLPDATVPILFDETGNGQHMTRGGAGGGLNYTVSYFFPTA